ncbi:MAG TPA: vanadium-dependent haloperoxidase, partial [Chitinophagaceae bacterium]|nr:vanadium-dependent haloperoxidase [Chitinophagaceae bacterium]
MKALKILMPLLLLAAVSCTEKGAQADLKFFDDQMLYCKTVKKLNDVVLENNFPPMIATRNYVYASIAAFECVVAGDDNYISLAGQIKHMPAMPKPATKDIDFSLAALLAFTKVGNAVTFPEGSMMGYYNDLIKHAEKAGLAAAVVKNTITFSDSVVAAIMRWSKKDNYAQTRTAERYTVLYNVPGRWIPTPPMYGTAVEPHWSEIRTMVMDSASQFRPVPPPVCDPKDKNGDFCKAMMEVKTIGENLTDEQKHIADFWDDNPFKMNVTGHVMFVTKKFSPPGHWMNIVGIGAKAAKADFKTTVAAYAQTAIALYDAFISCWEEKFRSNYVRPETEINKIDETWHPYIQTPPFPSYTSGHATNSSAAAEVMTH